MWQRPQTIYIILSLLALVIVFFVPSFSGTTPKGETITISTLEEMEVEPNGEVETKTEAEMAIPHVGALALVVAGLVLYARRKLQIRVLFVSILVQGLLVYLLVAHWYKEVGQMELIAPAIKTGLVLIMASVILNWLAIVYIRKDQNLVSSMDRLR